MKVEELIAAFHSDSSKYNRGLENSISSRKWVGERERQELMAKWNEKLRRVWDESNDGTSDIKNDTRNKAKQPARQRRK